MIYKDIKRPPRRSGGLFYRGSTLSAVLYRAADGVLSLSMKIIRFYIENCKGKYVFIAKCEIWWYSFVEPKHPGGIAKGPADGGAFCFHTL